MAWRCRFLTARQSQHGSVVAEKRLREESSGAPDSLVDFHTGSDADDDGTAAFLAWAGDSTRACPECHVLIYRSEGCAHMSCACGAEFNWDSAERVGGSSAAPPPTAPGARRVVGAEDIAVSYTHLTLPTILLV